MRQSDGEGKVRALQKEFLCWVEEHPELYALPPEEFNAIRRRAFRATFDAFRLGKIGLREDDLNEGVSLWAKFVDWGVLPSLSVQGRIQLQAKCFTVALSAFRAGAMVAGYEGG